MDTYAYLDSWAPCSQRKWVCEDGKASACNERQLDETCSSPHRLNKSDDQTNKLATDKWGGVGPLAQWKVLGVAQPDIFLFIFLVT